MNNFVTGKKGINLIKKFEGLRLRAYYCPAGKLTIGYGHTAGVKEKDKITELQAEGFLKQDLVKFQRAVNSLVKVPINQNQFDSLVSFAFNLGAGALQKSSLLRLLNSSDYGGASLHFSRWIKVNGKDSQGLITRRKAEEALFNERV
jgi:lysozyme